MRIALKESRLKRLEKILETNIFFIVCNNSSVTSEKLLKLTQGLFKLNLYCYRINNKLLKNVYTKTILKNYINSVNGSLMLVLLRNGSMPYNFMAVVNELKTYKIDVLYVYFNYKIYSINQLKELSYLNYESNIGLFYITLKNLLKIPCCKFIK
jgi:hypothetical protein